MQEPSTTEERDGCDCPSVYFVYREPALGKVLRCAHIDDCRVALLDTGSFWVQWIDPRCEDYCRDAEECPCIELHGHDFNAALAAFYEAEERLIRGDA